MSPTENYEVTELRPFDLVVDGLTRQQAYALAELCKRIGYSDCLTLAVSGDEARAMILAMERVRGGLEMVGAHVR